MKLYLHKTILSYILLFVLTIFIALAVVLPMYSRFQADAYLKQITMTELLPLSSAVSNVKGASPESRRECSERSLSPTSYLTRTLWCRESFLYRYDKKPLPDSAREDIIQKAGILDALLLQKGWEPARPDTTHTVVDAIPSEPKQAFHGDSVTFRKNVADVRCMLTIAFGGPTDGISPGVVSINNFSCMREVQFFSPHIPQFTKQGFTPI